MHSGARGRRGLQRKASFAAADGAAAILTNKFDTLAARVSTGAASTSVLATDADLDFLSVFQWVDVRLVMRQCSAGLCARSYKWRGKDGKISL